MARVLVYERTVKALISAINENYKSDHNSIGIFTKIKKEPEDISECQNTSKSNDGIQETLNNSKSWVDGNIMHNESTIDRLHPMVQRSMESSTTQDNSTIFERKNKKLNVPNPSPYVLHEGFQVARADRFTANILETTTKDNNEKRRKRKRSLENLAPDQVPEEDTRSKKTRLSTSLRRRNSDGTWLQVLQENKPKGRRKTTSHMPNDLIPRSDEIDKFYCNICQLSFDSRAQIVRHNVIYLKPCNFHCRPCNVRFPSQTKLTEHRKSAHSRAAISNSTLIMCDWCKQKFLKKSVLQAHLFHFHTALDFHEPRGAVSINLQEIRSLGLHPRVRTRRIHSENNLEVRKSRPDRKLRQTILTEFLQSSSVREEQESLVNAGQVNGSVSTQVDQYMEPCADPNDVRSTLGHVIKDFETEDDRKALQSGETSNKEWSRNNFQLDVTEYFERIDRRFSSKWRDKSAGDDMDQHLISPPETAIITKISSEESGLWPADERLNLKYFLSDGTTENQPLPESTYKLKMCRVHLVRLNESLIGTQHRRCSTTCDSTTQTILKDVHPNYPVLPVKIEAPDPNLHIAKLKRVEIKLVKLEHLGYTIPCPSRELSTRLLQEKAFNCNICEKTFHSKNEKKVHVKSFHVAYMSSICRARCSSKRLLLSHYLDQHPMYKKNGCCICRKRFANREKLKKHLLMHCIKVIRSKDDWLPIDIDTRCNLKKKMYKCSGCRKGFWLSTCLNEHEKVCKSRKRQMEDKPNNKSANGKSKGSLVKTYKDLLQLQSLRERILSTIDAKERETSTTKTPRSRGLEEPNDSNPPLGRTSGTASVEVESNDRSKCSSRFPCEICGTQFHTLNNLRRHVQTYLQLPRETCYICGTLFPNRRRLMMHVKIAHVNDSTVVYNWRCEICNHGFAKKKILRIHVMHTHYNCMATEAMFKEGSANINVNRMTCYTCAVPFKTENLMVDHFEHFNKALEWSCEVCNIVVKGRYALEKHRKSEHFGEMQQSYNFMCVLCTERFPELQQLRAHTMHVHRHDGRPAPPMIGTSAGFPGVHEIPTKREDVPTTGFGKHVCTVCQWSFPEEADLTAHVDENSNDGDYQCDRCGRRCRTLTLLEGHLAASHGNDGTNDEHACHFCGEVLKTHSCLISHEKHFHPESLNQPIGTHSTLEDLARPSLESVLKGALALNDDECVIEVGSETDGEATIRAGQLKCSVCGQVFESEFILMNHLLEYSNDGKYPCDVCDRKFVWASHLEEHKRKHGQSDDKSLDFCCPVCLEGFESMLALNAHGVHLHGGEFVHAVVARNAVDDAPNGNRPEDDGLGATTGEELDQSSALLYNDSTPLIIPNRGSGFRNTVNVIHPKLLTGGSTTSTDNAVIGNYIKCRTCNQNFANKDNLAKHQMRFWNEGNYSCEICGRKYPWPSLLKYHKRKHIPMYTNSMKEMCPICGEKFHTTASAKTHIIHLHKGYDVDPIKLTGNKPGSNSKNVDSSRMRHPVNSKVGKDSPNLNPVFSSVDFVNESQEESQMFELDADTTKEDCKDPLALDDICKVEELADALNAGDVSQSGSFSGNAEMPANVSLPESTAAVSSEASSSSGKYKCFMCSGEYATVSKFQFHLETVHSHYASRSFHSARMKTSGAVLNRMQEELATPGTPENLTSILKQALTAPCISDPCFCESCRQKFPDQRTSCIGDVPLGQVCDICGMSFDNGYLCKKHKESVHARRTDAAVGDQDRNRSSQDHPVHEDDRRAPRRIVSGPVEITDVYEEIEIVDPMSHNAGNNAEDVSSKTSAPDGPRDGTILKVLRHGAVAKKQQMGKLKVKPFAKIVENLTIGSLSKRKSSADGYIHGETGAGPSNDRNFFQPTLEAATRSDYSKRNPLSHNVPKRMHSLDEGAGNHYYDHTYHRSKLQDSAVGRTRGATSKPPDSISSPHVNVSRESVITSTANPTLYSAPLNLVVPSKSYATSENPVVTSVINPRPDPTDNGPESADPRKATPESRELVATNSNVIYKCQICLVHFTDKSKWDKHASTRCWLFRCATCKMSFADDRSLQKHFREHFSRTCQVCKSVFFSCNAFEEHSKYCYNSPAFAVERLCRVCNRVVPPGVDMQNHIFMHKTKLIKCGICKRQFDTVSDAATHFRIFHQPFRCNVCKACFVEKETLATHIKDVHDPQARVCFCAVCKVGFRSWVDYNVHSCDIC
ncbi:uncharacterized protein LOC105703542 [Orussus abietinus]|uniref:uncharacterized protein LOC105703542 n=1 Tax=Orussus abietinus TaxID=222816 RepID=UPI0006251E23|nr:uncharacterized protein LOC105703542 [Orussus abietinus]